MFQQRYPDIEDAQYMICGEHARKFASWVAIVQIICDAGLWFLLAGLVKGDYVVYMCNIFFLCLVLLGDKFEQHTFYLPVIVLTTIGIILSGLACLFFSLLLMIPVQMLIDNDTSTFLQPQQHIGWIMVFLIVLFVTEVYLILTWQVYYRAWRYMKDEVHSGARDRSHAKRQAMPLIGI